jgi:hypothetical protein
VATPVLTLRRLAAPLPLVFILHVSEEAPGFFEWFNVTRPISQRLFLSVNVIAFVITVLVAILAALVNFV